MGEKAITVKDVTSALATCAQLRSIIRNERRPDYTFISSLKHIENVLESILEVKETQND